MFGKIPSKILGLILSTMGLGVILLVLAPEIYGEMADLVTGIIGIIILLIGIFKLLK
jgi:hypothetical protein